MRNYQEIAEIVKERGDAVIAERSARIQHRKRITLSVSGVAVSAAAAFCIWQNMGTDRYIAPRPDNSNIIEDMPEVTTSPDTEKVSESGSSTVKQTTTSATATKAVTTSASSSALTTSSKSAAATSAVTEKKQTSSNIETVSTVPAETTVAVTSFDYDLVYNEGRVIMKRFAALSTALLALVNTAPANAAEPLQYRYTDKYRDYIQNFIDFTEENELAVDFNGDGKVDIFDDYAFVRSSSSGCPEYIMKNVNACKEKIKEFKKETGIEVNINDFPEYFVNTQPVELEYYDPNFYIDNCPDIYDEPVPLEKIRHDDGEFDITEFYDSMYYTERNGEYIREDYHYISPYGEISPIHYFIEYYLKSYTCNTNASYNNMCKLMDGGLVDADINSDGVFDFNDAMMLQFFREQFYDDYSETIYGYWDDNDVYHELDAGQVHERKRTYAGFLEDYEEFLDTMKLAPTYSEETDYTTNHKLTESEWEKATAFYDTASMYALHDFIDIDEHLFIYYITHYDNIDPEIFNDSYYVNNKDHYICWNIFGYLRRYKEIYETYGVNAVRQPGEGTVDPRFAKYDTEKMFPEYYAAVKGGELPEPDINKDGKVDIQDYAFFRDLFAEIEEPDAPSYMIYVTIDAPQAVRDAFNNDYDFNNNGVSCDIGELECIELYIAKAVGASDYDDILDMLDKYYAANPSLDPMVKLDEIIKNMADNTTKKEETNDTEQKMQSYMSAFDLFKTVNGDSNIDGDVDLSDAVLIMQSLANPDKYQLTPQGIKNADGNGDGVTNGDAAAIQRRLLGLE